MKNNKSLIALFLLFVGGIIGLTMAYFSDYVTVENKFKSQKYATSYVENFISPDNWKPGDKTDKTLQVQNIGNVDQAVKVTYDEKWLNAKGEELPLKQDNQDIAALIHWTNSNDWTQVDNTFYYNYKLAPNEETSTLLDYVTFNPLIRSNTNCNETVVDGVITKICNSNGTGYDGARYTLTLTVETVQYDMYRDAWNTNVSIAAQRPVAEQPKSISEYLIANATNSSTITSYNDVNADKSKMFTFDNNGTSELRYIGNDANNYVQFNCDNDGNCETWMIIGIFNVEDKNGVVEPRVKLVRFTEIEEGYEWDAKGEYGENDWTTSEINNYLNGDYYNGTLSKGLKNSAREMITEVKYHLGSVARDDSNHFGDAGQIYNYENGNALCGACGDDVTKLTWTGNVSLMFASDQYMVYAKGVNDVCYNNPHECTDDNAKTGWIYNTNFYATSPISTWLLTVQSDDETGVLLSANDGSLQDAYAFVTVGVRPVVYLSNNVKIVGGDGTSDNQYRLEKIQ